ncbi:MAG: HEPN domain-containing protein [Candidatus Brocadiales bacterium]|nr:HEPN domain-containing protein [Candidatus Brocadiales bacterium]
MADPEVVEEWIRWADNDLAFASACLEDKDRYIAQICFHLHQAVEKYLKAFIIANELEFEKIHDLVKLLKTCTTKKPVLTDLREACEFLNPFYIETRYPVSWPVHHTKEEAQQAKEFATSIGNTIKGHLGKQRGFR